ncbi:hypothetical protein VFPPC_16586 [Pochonia chlamydosporia 170]|uniref:Uncharacterized protein n=1 Tax=Pochonia chlamydosporia 170 TaxID=1380566 RepID=A0A179F9G0_METCM|nr:hypothetical protein VFPPC_16586 [Pochonia chlamydosporia 170]OAQ61970.1 hypothetical protein VFPPC_16586 [Pochonia chlamydosporia 170]
MRGKACLGARCSRCRGDGVWLGGLRRLQRRGLAALRILTFFEATGVVTVEITESIITLPKKAGPCGSLP